MGFDARRIVNTIPVVGPLSKSIFGDPDEENLRAQLEKMSQTFQQYRPQAAQARMTGLGNQLSLFGPINSLLSQMYPGSGFNFDTSKLMQNPMSGVQAGLPPTDSRLLNGQSFDTAYSGPKIDDSKVATRAL